MLQPVVTACMLYNFRPEFNLADRPANKELTFKYVDDFNFIAQLNNISNEEARRRLANDNTFYAALYRDEPAAFGWSASGSAYIGELDHQMVLPFQHKYLWNFRTVEKFRGKGIYPQLLQHILRSEIDNTECFWILHSPENIASQKGILKAGFQLVGQVSIKNLDRVIVSSTMDLKHVELLGFEFSSEEQGYMLDVFKPIPEL